MRPSLASVNKNSLRIFQFWIRFAEALADGREGEGVVNVFPNGGDDPRLFFLLNASKHSYEELRVG